MSAPPFRWFGSKARLAPELAAMLPPHDHYVEVFAGSAAVLFAKPRSRLETLNDVDGRVVNLFAVLRDPALTAELLAAVELTPYARAEHVMSRQWQDDLDAPPAERARRFLVVVNQAIGASTRSGWSRVIASNSVGRAQRSERWALPDRLAVAAARLVAVQIENRDWRDVLTDYDAPGVALFVDPPYVHETRGRPEGYRHEMTDVDHGELVDALLALAHATAVVTHYPHPTYDRLTAAGWHVTDMSGYADKAGSRGRGQRVERVWVSPGHSRQLALG